MSASPQVIEILVWVVVGTVILSSIRAVALSWDSTIRPAIIDFFEEVPEATMVTAGARKPASDVEIPIARAASSKPVVTAYPRR